MGTHERFIGFLLEHYAGKFPLWLAPLQVKILPISDKFMDYGVTVLQKLKAAGIRAEIDDRNEKIGKKIRDTELMKVPYMLVFGEKEIEIPWLGEKLDPKFLQTITLLSVDMEWDCEQAAAFCATLLQNVNHPMTGEANYILSLL